MIGTSTVQLLMLSAQGLCNSRVSVCLSHQWTAATVAGGCAAERPVGRTYQSTVVGAMLPALSSKRG